jgi:hypothetical protein
MLRCAVYTRKSSEHGLEQDFNSLDAQREAAEAYIKSQAHERLAVFPGCGSTSIGILCVGKELNVLRLNIAYAHGRNPPRPRALFGSCATACASFKMMSQKDLGCPASPN